MVVKMIVKKMVSITHGHYSIELDAHDEMGMVWVNYDGMKKSTSEKTGRKLDKLNGAYQLPYTYGWRGSSFHIDLEHAKELREILDEYIAYKEGSQ